LKIERSIDNMRTWNDVFTERLFNNSTFDGESFSLPEGYGSEKNYARVIGLWRMLCELPASWDYKIKLAESGQWYGIKGDKRGYGDTPEEAIENLISEIKTL